MTSRCLLRDGLQQPELSASVGGSPSNRGTAPPELQVRPVTGIYWWELKVNEELVTDRYVGPTVFTVVAGVGIMISTSKALSFILLLYILMVIAECAVNNGGQIKKLQSRETNVFNFLRLLIMRLVYGVATAMGFSDGISEFMGGAFVPPGVDDDYGDYADYDF